MATPVGGILCFSCVGQFARSSRSSIPSTPSGRVQRIRVFKATTSALLLPLTRSPLRPNFPNESAVSFERGVEAVLRYILPRIAAEAFA